MVLGVLYVFHRGVKENGSGATALSRRLYFQRKPTGILLDNSIAGHGD